MGVPAKLFVGNIKVGVPVVANVGWPIGWPMGVPAETNIMVPLGPWVKMGRFG